MVQSRALRLSICAVLSWPLTVSDACERSAPRPTSTAEMVAEASAGSLAPLAGAMVLTIGGCATALGDGTTEAAAPGDGLGSGLKRRASLGCSVGGAPGVAAASVPGAAPRKGRSMA